MMYSPVILFLIYLFSGFVGAIVFDLTYPLQLIFKGNQIMTVICDIVSTLGCGVLIIALNITINCGMPRAYLTMAFILGIVLQRKTLGKLFAKCSKKIYNWLSKVIKNVKNSKTFAALSK